MFKIDKEYLEKIIIDILKKSDGENNIKDKFPIVILVTDGAQNTPRYLFVEYAGLSDNSALSEGLVGKKGGGIHEFTFVYLKDRVNTENNSVMKSESLGKGNYGEVFNSITAFFPVEKNIYSKPVFLENKVKKFIFVPGKEGEEQCANEVQFFNASVPDKEKAQVTDKNAKITLKKADLSEPSIKDKDELNTLIVNSYQPYYIIGQERYEGEILSENSQYDHKISAGMYQAINAVYKAGIIHNDVKGSNFIVNPCTKEVKLIDFGVSLSTQSANYNPHSGTPLYNDIYTLCDTVKKDQDRPVNIIKIEEDNNSNTAEEPKEPENLNNAYRLSKTKTISKDNDFHQEAYIVVNRVNNDSKKYAVKNIDIHACHIQIILPFLNNREDLLNRLDYRNDMQEETVYVTNLEAFFRLLNELRISHLNIKDTFLCDNTGITKKDLATVFERLIKHHDLNDQIPEEPASAFAHLQFYITFLNEKLKNSNYFSCIFNSENDNYLSENQLFLKQLVQKITSLSLEEKQDPIYYLFVRQALCERLQACLKTQELNENEKSVLPDFSLLSQSCEKEFISYNFSGKDPSAQASCLYAKMDKEYSYQNRENEIEKNKNLYKKQFFELKELPDDFKRIDLALNVLENKEKTICKKEVKKLAFYEAIKARISKLDTDINIWDLAEQTRYNNTDDKEADETGETKKRTKSANKLSNLRNQAKKRYLLFKEILAALDNENFSVLMELLSFLSVEDKEILQFSLPANEEKTLKSTAKIDFSLFKKLLDHLIFLEDEAYSAFKENKASMQKYDIENIKKYLEIYDNLIVLSEKEKQETGIMDKLFKKAEPLIQNSLTQKETIKKSKETILTQKETIKKSKETILHKKAMREYQKNLGILVCFILGVILAGLITALILLAVAAFLFSLVFPLVFLLTIFFSGTAILTAEIAGMFAIFACKQAIAAKNLNVITEKYERQSDELEKISTMLFGKSMF